MNHENYTSSISYDKRLYKQDILGSIAHVKMLSKQNIISSKESEQIINGLNQIKSEIETETFSWNENLEDIHMNIENRLFEIIGKTAGKLHTGRSRNDQVSTDMRLFVKEETINVVKAITCLLYTSPSPRD